MILLDTNVLSELMRERPNPDIRHWLDGTDNQTLATTAITVAEINYGIARLPNGCRKSTLAEAADAMFAEDFADLLLPFDSSAAQVYGELVANCDKAGQPISMADAQIAAICLIQNATLATRNVQDFSMAGLDVVNPWTTSISR